MFAPDEVVILLLSGLYQPSKVSPVTVHVTDAVVPTLADISGIDSVTSAPKTIKKRIHFSHIYTYSYLYNSAAYQLSLDLSQLVHIWREAIDPK